MSLAQAELVATAETPMMALQTTAAAEVELEDIQEQAEQVPRTTPQHQAGMVPVEQAVERGEIPAAAVLEFMVKALAGLAVRRGLGAAEVQPQPKPAVAV